MASDFEFAEYVCEQMRDAGLITYRRMFGEFAIYCDAKVVAFVCDNCLFVKPTAGARAAAEPIEEGFPYPGAKPHWVVRERLDDRAWIASLIRLTAAELPLPKTRMPRASAGGKARKTARGSKG